MDKKTASLEKKTSLPSKKGKKLGAPDIDSMFDSSGLPGLPPISNDLTKEETADQEIDDMMALIRENRKNYAEHFRDVEAGEFWFCVCFQSRSQKEKFVNDFLKKYAANVTVETFGDKYVSGLEMAAYLDIPVEPITLEVKKAKLTPKNLRETEVIK